MPYGQNAASRAHALKLNATSEFLWDALVRGLDEDQLLSLAAKEFEATEEDLPVLREDIRHFIKSGLWYLHTMVRANYITDFSRNLHATKSSMQIRRSI